VIIPSSETARIDPLGASNFRLLPNDLLLFVVNVIQEIHGFGGVANFGKTCKTFYDLCINHVKLYSQMRAFFSPIYNKSQISVNRFPTAVRPWVRRANNGAVWCQHASKSEVVVISPGGQRETINLQGHKCFSVHPTEEGYLLLVKEDSVERFVFNENGGLDKMPSLEEKLGSYERLWVGGKRLIFIREDEGELDLYIYDLKQQTLEKIKEYPDEVEDKNALLKDGRIEFTGNYFLILDRKTLASYSLNICDGEKKFLNLSTPMRGEHEVRSWGDWAVFYNVYEDGAPLEIIHLPDGKSWSEEIDAQKNFNVAIQLYKGVLLCSYLNKSREQISFALCLDPLLPPRKRVPLKFKGGVISFWENMTLTEDAKGALKIFSSKIVKAPKSITPEIPPERAPVAKRRHTDSIIIALAAITFLAIGAIGLSLVLGTSWGRAFFIIQGSPVPSLLIFSISGAIGLGLSSAACYFILTKK